MWVAPSWCGGSIFAQRAGCTHIQLMFSTFFRLRFFAFLFSVLNLTEVLKSNFRRLSTGYYLRVMDNVLSLMSRAITHYQQLATQL